MPKKKAPRAFVVAAASLAALAACAALELLLRATGADLALIGRLLRYQGSDLEVHRVSEAPGLLYELKPSARVVTREGRVLTTNALGFRDPERSPAKRPGTRRVLCLGGSNTFGSLVADRETWPAQLERRLNEGGGRWEVWNLGVAGYTPRQAERLLRLAWRFEPDMIVYQHFNGGPRLFLLGEPYGRFFEKEPELFLENLRRRLPLPDKAHRMLLRSALARTLMIALNRVDPFPPRHARYFDDREPLTALVEQSRARGVPFLLLMTPRASRGSWEEDAPPMLDLEKRLPPGAGPEYLEIHPRPEVYAWYARELEPLVRSSLSH